jgi:hypothetical protein
VNPTLLGGLGLLALVVAVGLFLRRAGGADAANAPPEDSVSEGANPAPETLGRDDDPEDDDDGLVIPEDQVVAVTSDGAALYPDRHAVRLVPPADDEDAAWSARDAGQRARNRRGDLALSMSWHAGDLTGVRIRRGDPDEGPWRLDMLGRDGEYQALVFETEGGAHAARELFEGKGIVRIGRDEDDRPVPPSAEQFDEARRIFLETEQALHDPEDGRP